MNHKNGLFMREIQLSNLMIQSKWLPATGVEDYQ